MAARGTRDSTALSGLTGLVRIRSSMEAKAKAIRSTRDTEWLVGCDDGAIGEIMKRGRLDTLIQPTHYLRLKGFRLMRPVKRPHGVNRVTHGPQKRIN